MGGEGSEAVARKQPNMDRPPPSKLTFFRWSSIPGRIMMTDTSVPSSSRKEKASRLTVELYADGQQDERRQEAEPHKQEAWGGGGGRGEPG